jgi:O-antigen/teichoic acid export membrane protein
MKPLHSTIANVIGVAGTAVAGILATSVMARNLSVADFGRVAILLVVVNAIAVFEGLRPVIIYHLAHGQISSRELYAGGHRIAAIVGGAAALGVFAVLSLVSRFQISISEAAIVAGAVLVFFPTAIFWGFLDGVYDTAFTGVVRAVGWICAYSLFIVLALVGAPFIAYAAVLLAMNCGLLLAFYLRNRAHGAPLRAKPTRSVVRELWRLGFDNIALNVSAVTMGTADRLIIGTVAGPTAVGLYSGPYELATKPIAFVRAIAQVLGPVAARRVAATGAVGPEWAIALVTSTATAVTGCAGVIAWREAVVLLILGRRYLTASDVFGLLVLAFPMVVAGFNANVSLNARGDFRTQRSYYAVAAALMVVTLWAGVRQFGVAGAAFIYLATRSVDLALTLRVVRTEARSLWSSRGAALAASMAAALALGWFHAIGAMLCAIGIMWLLVLTSVRAGRLAR